jgi:hypothetical protein
VDQRAVPDRRQRILAPLGDLTGTGLEIGALHHPIIDRSTSNANVLYVDHTDTAALHDKYAYDSEVGEIVDVDVVWSDQSLADALGDRAPVDWAIASHVLEHVPNLVGWLDQLAEVMRDTGLLSLAIPDKRFCFDVNRRETDPSDVVGAWLGDHKRPSLATIYEFYARVTTVDAGKAWAGAYRLLPSDDNVEQGLAFARKAAETDDYVDVHCWTFTPESFLSTLRTLFRLGLTSFRVVDFSPTLPNELEFFCVLERLPRTLAADERIEAQLMSLPATAPGRNKLDDGTEVMVLSSREARLVEAKRRAVMAARRAVARIRRF